MVTHSSRLRSPSLLYLHLILNESVIKAMMSRSCMWHDVFKCGTCLGVTHHGWEALILCICTWYSMSDTPRSYVWRIWARHVTHMNATYMSEARHTYERGHIWMPHISARHLAYICGMLCSNLWPRASLIYVAFICVTCLAHIRHTFEHMNEGCHS